MKKNNTIIAGKDIQELKKELVEIREQLRMHRFNTAGARSKDSSVPKKSRAQISRILAELALRSKKSLVMTNI